MDRSLYLIVSVVTADSVLVVTGWSDLDSVVTVVDTDSVVTGWDVTDSVADTDSGVIKTVSGTDPPTR